MPATIRRLASPLLQAQNGGNTLAGSLGLSSGGDPSQVTGDTLAARQRQDTTLADNLPGGPGGTVDPIEPSLPGTLGIPRRPASGVPSVTSTNQLPTDLPPGLIPMLPPPDGTRQPPTGTRPTLGERTQPSIPGPGRPEGSLDAISQENLNLLLETLLKPGSFDIDAVREFQEFQTSELDRQAEQARGRLLAEMARRSTFYGTPTLQGLGGIEGELQRGRGELASAISLEQARSQSRDRLGALAAASQLLGQQQGGEQFNAALAMQLLGMGLGGDFDMNAIMSLLGGGGGAGGSAGGLGGLGAILPFLLQGSGSGLGGLDDYQPRQLNFDPYGSRTV